MPTLSPTTSRKHEAGVRYSSPTRLVDEDDLTPPPRQPRPVIGLRLRADSDGSTNNAFFRDGHPPLPASSLTAYRHQRNKKKKQQQRKKQKHGERARPTIVDVEEGEMADVMNRTPAVAVSSATMTHDKLDFWPRSAWEQTGFLQETAPPDISKEFSASSGRDYNRNSSTSAAQDSLRFSDVSISESLIGAHLMESSTRLSDVQRVSTRSSMSKQIRASATSIKGDKRPSQVGKNTDPTERAGFSSKAKSKPLHTLSDDHSDDNDYLDDFDDEFEDDKVKFVGNSSIWEMLKFWLNPTPWLIADVNFDDRGTPYFDAAQEWTLAGLVRYHLYNPIAPEFTSLQQFWWAVIIGIVMGVYTALWKLLIEAGVDFVWETVPEFLLLLGVFTDLNGSFPIFHYMWICPMIFGGILSYLFCILPVPIPGQNEWIKNLHTRGVQDYRTFWPLFVLATLGMLSGLSLGPELPLVLTAGMFGSWLGILCKQSMLQARVLNLTAASAAVGGFFGFPMAGALFVLEIPHRMGLQYFEALSPATISSIIAVVTNRIIIRNDITGYFKYPFLSDSLPSQIFTHAIIYGLYGAVIGIIYAFAVMKLKGWVHDWFHVPHHHHEEEIPIDEDGSMHYHHLTEPETKPLVDKFPSQRRYSAVTSFSSLDSWTNWSKKLCSLKRLRRLLCCVIPYEPYRASVAGAIAGALCGGVAIFVPHTLFWGEAQLQNLIDKGRTPLPVFGQGDEPTADLTALGYCMIDTTDPDAIKAGFSMQCSLLLMVSKTIVIGLSLGTGIIGGHFWGPLFIGCAAGHFLYDLTSAVESLVGFGGSLASYPCLIILCTMGAAHVVSFRAHTAIMLILTLTISSFTAEDDSISIAGDYSAVFPLLVISCFVSLMVSRQSIVFYKEQRSRGDITAVPEVLCEPGMEGRPLVHTYDAMDDEFDGDEGDFANNDPTGPADVPLSILTTSNAGKTNVRSIAAELTQDDIEKAFKRENKQARGVYGSLDIEEKKPDPYRAVLPPIQTGGDASSNKGSAFSRLDELLSAPLDPDAAKLRTPSPNSLSDGAKKKSHRRIQSAPAVDPRMRLSLKMERKDSATRFDSRISGKSPTERSSRSSSIVMRVESFGELHEHQPPLLEQARLRAASRELIASPEDKKHRRSPSTPVPTSVGVSSLVESNSGGRGRRSRKNSATEATGDPFDLSGALSLDEIEESFNAAVRATMTQGSHP